MGGTGETMKKKSSGLSEAAVAAIANQGSSISLEILREHGAMTLRDLTAWTARWTNSDQYYENVASVMRRHEREGTARRQTVNSDWRNEIWEAVSPDVVVERIQRWCGVCFAWKEEVEGRCASCGNKYMTGRGLPIEDVVVTNDDSGYGKLVANMRADADNQEARGSDPANIGALRTVASFISTGRWGENPRRISP